MRHGIQDEDTEVLFARAEAAVDRGGARYRTSVCSYCAGSGIPMKRNPESPGTLEACSACLGVGKVWRITEGTSEHLCNAREVLARYEKR